MKIRQRRQQELEVNLTPLIDVVFLLLIFFMVTTSFKHETQIGIELPQAQKQQPVDRQNTIEIGITAKGHYTLQGQPIYGNDATQLKGEIAKLINTDEKPKLIIMGDKLAPHQSVVSAMEVAGQLGIHTIQIVADSNA